MATKFAAPTSSRASRRVGRWIVWLLIAFPPAAYPQLVVNGGFETPEETGGPADRFADSFGAWSGDTTMIVAAKDGITPFQGSRMLQFQYAFFSASPFNASQTHQLIDAAPFAAEIARGAAVARASAWVNRVAGDAQTDTAFSLVLGAYGGSPDSFGAQINSGTWLERVGSTLFADDDPSTWERIEVQLLLPPGTDFIEVEITANENVFNDFVGVEFDGHYADAVDAVVVLAHDGTVPALSTGGILLMAIILAGLGLGLLRRSIA